MSDPTVASRARTREAPTATAGREAVLAALLAHDMALRALLGGRRAEPVARVWESWRTLFCAALRRLPEGAAEARPIDGLRLHLDALRAAGLPSSDIIAAVNAWRMERVQ